MAIDLQRKMMVYYHSPVAAIYNAYSCILTYTMLILLFAELM